MALMNTKTLSGHLVTFGAATKTFSAHVFASWMSMHKAPMVEGFTLGVGTFRHMSLVYLYCPDMATRYRLEAFLLAKGAEVNRDYAPTCATVEVQVRTFGKGQHT